MEQIQQPGQGKPMTGMGYLIVRVSTASGAIPVEGATVTVRSNMADQNGNVGGILHVLTSDRDGNTIRLALPAPARAESMSPGNGIPYATYNIDVVADGFYPQYYVNVPLYDTITSIQPAVMIPWASGAVIDRENPMGEIVEEGSNPELQS